MMSLVTYVSPVLLASTIFTDDVYLSPYPRCSRLINAGGHITQYPSLPIGAFQASSLFGWGVALALVSACTCLASADDRLPQCEADESL